MRLFTPEINWHNKDPIYSVDISECSDGKPRLASCSTDTSVRIWSVEVVNEKIEIKFRSVLERHSKPVNIVRFSKNGSLLASSGDDGLIILWNLINPNLTIDENKKDSLEDIPNLEEWAVVRIINAHKEDIYDLCWSPDSKYILTASVDNSASIFEVARGTSLHTLKDAKHYVQGVCWDPLDEFFVTLSSDATYRVYSSISKKLLISSKRAEIKCESSTKICKLYRAEDLQSFFRRCSFSPDGLLLATPTGISIMENTESSDSVTFLYSRDNLGQPLIELPTFGKDSIAAKFCHLIFKPRTNSSEKLFNVDYRMLLAVATLDSLLLYDTELLHPFGIVNSIHYAVLTDVCWSTDASFLMVSSLDGFCSIVFLDCANLIIKCASSIRPTIQSGSLFPINSVTSNSIETPPKKRVSLFSVNEKDIIPSQTPPTTISAASASKSRRVSFTTLQTYTP